MAWLLALEGNRMTTRMTAADYERTAQEYQASLPLEHYMEATPHATQRAITVASLALYKLRRPVIQYFNELLVQYFFEGNLRYVVPDNMLTKDPAPEVDRTSFAVELEAAAIFLILEYVSASSKRKDYQDNFHKYERELKVPYYLIFDPERLDLRLFRNNGEGYVRMEANTHGRYAIEELELEVGLLKGWVRFWHRGELLELPVELQDRLDQKEKQITELQTNLKKQTAALQVSQSTIEQQSETLKSREETIQQQTEALKSRDAAIQQQAEAMKSKEATIQQQTNQLAQMLDSLRRDVEERARRAGRQDILERLSPSSDWAQLSQWAAELR
jgi:Uma2 family endonuclease